MTIVELTLETISVVETILGHLKNATAGKITPEQAHDAISELHKNLADARAKRDAELAEKFK